MYEDNIQRQGSLQRRAYFQQIMRKRKTGLKLSCGNSF